MGPFFESGSEASVIVRFPSGINNDNVQRGCVESSPVALVAFFEGEISVVFRS